MDNSALAPLLRGNESKILFLVLDGLGGLPFPGKGGSELEVARIPNLDRLAAESATGLLDPVAPGIIPGSGPGHLALFGYDPLEWDIGRGVLAALGVELELTPRDVAVRINFATYAEDGTIADRRAGRIDDATNRRLIERLEQQLDLGDGIEVILRTVKEHRAVLVLRGDGLGGNVTDTDPGVTGQAPLTPRGENPGSEPTARLAQEFSLQTRRILAGEPRANGVLLRGFAKHPDMPPFATRYRLRALAVARYPDYRGISSLLGMNVLYQKFADLREQLGAVRQHWNDFDFFFVHEKGTDARGEDGDFDGKVKVLEMVDALVPGIRELGADVLVVTGDHSTPALMRAHSFHPVPLLLHAKVARVDRVQRFDEFSCATGSLGRLPMTALMRLALAHAGRLSKYGA